ncbi:MAG: isopentenyl-diphosphate Delta-isomerase [Gemmatimonadetes bacterium]|nr:isopentenyl-diphosphate Delta-isomerase [Gemmatimonadota bacterium]
MGKPKVERVVLVDSQGVEIGTAEKMDAHRYAQIHRAFSVFVFNGAGEMLLQRRASGKYHSPGRWSNACCGHPRPGEDPLDGARRRLREEMGLDCALTEALRFTYRADVGSDLVEHEYDHVFTGLSDAVPMPDVMEADAWCWLAVEEVLKSVESQPSRYTAWLAIAMHEMLNHGILER